MKGIAVVRRLGLELPQSARGILQSYVRFGETTRPRTTTEMGALQTNDVDRGSRRRVDIIDVSLGGFRSFSCRMRTVGIRPERVIAIHKVKLWLLYARGSRRPSTLRRPGRVRPSQCSKRRWPPCEAQQLPCTDTSRPLRGLNFDASAASQKLCHIGFKGPARS